MLMREGCAQLLLHYQLRNERGQSICCKARWAPGPCFCVDLGIQCQATRLVPGVPSWTVRCGSQKLLRVQVPAALGCSSGFPN
jgi:hypothetical protein